MPLSAASSASERNASPPRKLVLLAACAMVVAALFSTGTHHADEHYQILEFANTKLGLSPVADLPWEYAERMRPALQPAIVVALHRALNVFGAVDPFLLTTLLRLLSGALWLLATVQLLRALLPRVHGAGAQRWLVLLSFFLWFAVYDAVRFSSENWSGSFFALGLATVLLRRDTRRMHLLAGIALGLAIVLRVQTVLLVAGLLGWLLLIDRRAWRPLAALLSGIVVSIAFGLLVDHWFYGEWVLTAWRYFDLNVLQGRAASFGTEPWWWYFAAIFERAVLPISLFVITAPLVVMARDRRNAISWVLLPFVLAHVLVGHKELRFLFPLIGLLPYCMVRATELVRARSGDGWLSHPAAGWAMRLGWSVNLVLLAVVMLKPADSDMPLFRHVWRSYPQAVSIYHTGDDPYHGTDARHFYRRADWVMAGAFAPGKVNEADQPSIILTRDQDFAAHPPQGWVESYRSLPAWLDHFNFNGWVDRTERWYVFEQRTPTDAPDPEH